MEGCKRLIIPEPLSYIRFMNLESNSLFVITDSGGIQEETSYLGIPCMTVRKNTERAVTITHVTNQLCELPDLPAKTDKILENHVRRPVKIELWDGMTAARIVNEIRNLPFGYGPGKKTHESSSFAN